MKEKVILFDGTNTDAFVEYPSGEVVKWDVRDGVMTVTHGNIVSKYTYGDAHIHVEFNLPYMPWESGQFRGNSGVYINGCYEIQILDTYGKETLEHNDCGAIYEMHTPLVNACKAPGEWQTYDLIVKAAKLNEDGTIAEAARLTAILNGQVVQNNVILHRNTPGGPIEEVVERGPLYLQDHGCPVQFRNVWVQPLD